MSGDVQPRKRKDKKKKRDDEASHGVHVTKMGSDDVLLHIHEEHGTGGHWCAKIIFFSLMTILMGLVCLIILENRGISDVDTPLSESRFSDYFDGWVDEHRGDHDDHHDSHGSLEHDDHEGDGEDDDHDDHDDEDDHDEPFEEEADHSEGDEEVAEEEDDNVTPEEEDEDADNATTENITAEEEEEDDEDDEQVDGDDEEENVTPEVDDNVTGEDGDDDNGTGEDENVTQEATVEQDDAADDDDEDDDNDGNNTNEDVEDDNETKETSKPGSQGVPDDDDDPFDEEDDDGAFDSLEQIVDNDAAELDLLKEKARLQAAAESKQNPNSAENDIEDEADSAPSWASSQIKPKTGGGPQSLEDDLFEQELRRANDEMMRERYDDALNSFDRLIQKYPSEPQGYLGKAQTLDHYAEQRQSNDLLRKAIAMYKHYLDFNVKDNQLQEYRSAAERCVERMRFLGNYQQSLSVHELLIEKFPQESSIRNQLAVTLLMLNRLSDAKQVLQKILQLWPQDGLALVNYGFVLKQLDQDYHNASVYLRQGIESNAQGTQDGRFYFQLGESLQRLGKQHEAVEVFRKGAALKLFPSIYQRSLYNEANLKAQPFWSLEETGYEKFLKKLQDNWLAIQAEGLNILSKAGYFLNEAENLKNTGDWKQFELYARGQQRRENCLKAPITCSLINEFPAARECRRGQVKFSVMHAGTHIWPHCGPTNCRLRAHLGLVVPSGTRIRVAEQQRSWQEGKFLIFDDSFEHEVWHEGQGLRLVLIVDVWHPELTEQQRRSISPI